MADLHGPPDVLAYVDGYNLSTWQIQNLEVDDEAETDETSGLGSSDFRKHAPTGMRKAEVVISGALLDTAGVRSHAGLATKLTDTPNEAKRIMCVGFEGGNIGDNAIGWEGALQLNYKVLGSLDGLNRVNANWLISGRRDVGQIIQPLQTKTANFDTESTSADYALDKQQRVVAITSNSQASPSVITCPAPHGLTSGDRVLISGVSNSDADINGENVVTVISTTTFSVPVNAGVAGGTGGSFVRSDSSNGAVGYMQMIDGDGFTNFVGKVRDSVDDVTFADLITFTDSVLDPLAERITVAGQIDRYTAFDGVVTGSGTVSVFSMLART